MTLASYTELASLLAKFPRLAGLGKFSQLNIELLLYKQAEINLIELEIEALREVESPETAQSWQSWRKLAGTNSSSVAGQKFTKFQELDTKMKAYHEHLLRLVHLESLPRSPEADTEALSNWLASDNGNADIPKGVEARPWRSIFANDRIPLGHHQPMEGIDRVLESKVMPVWYRLAFRFVCHWQKPVPDEETGRGRVWHLKAINWVRVADACCVITSAAIPSISILALLFVDPQAGRVMIITAFSLIFAGIVLFVFGCKRSETFAATIAFAAVQVVFLEGVKDNKAS